MAQNEKVFAGVRSDIVRDAKLLQQIVKNKYGIDILYIWGLKTFAQQASIYASGRTKPGKIVTNAKAGESYHNYGFALDFCILTNGKADWKCIEKYKLVGQEAVKLKFTWGGNFKSFKDYGHIERNYGFTIKDLLAGKRPK